MGWDGQWIPTVRLVKVNRSPLTRRWTSGDHRNADGQRRPDGRDQAIWIESADSVGFSMGFTCTGFIAEDDAAKFLYWYPSGTLADVLDREVRGRIQQAAAEVAARYPSTNCGAEAGDQRRGEAGPTNYFSGRGITITTVGMFGGMTYENPAIQKSIDETFIAQQLRSFPPPSLRRNKRKTTASNSRQRARPSRRSARRSDSPIPAGPPRRRKRPRSAKSIGRPKRSQSAPPAAQIPRSGKARVEKWDGRYPQTWLGAGGTGTPTVVLPLPPRSQQIATPLGPV